MISFALEEEQTLVVDSVRKLAAEHLRPRLREAEEKGLRKDVLERAHELGLGLIGVPEALGGHGAPLITEVLVAEELSFGDPGAAVALAARGLGLEAILALGDEAQQQRLFPRFTASDGWRRAAALAYAERGGPLDGFGTRAVRAGDGWVLDGKKCFVSGAEGAELVVVFAQVEGDGWPHVGAFVVEKGTVGLTVGPRQRLLGLEASPVYELTLDGCRVGDEGRLCGGGDFMAAARGLFSRLGLLQAARQVGLARASYENALEYTQERKAFGKPVAHFQSIAFALADMHMDVEAARWMVWKAATSGQAEDIAAAVAHANEAAWRVADLGVQLLGGAGFVKDFPAEKWLRDTRALSLHAPPSECATLGIAAAELGQAIDGLPSTGIQPFVT